jgi:hypothetical protein
MFGEQAEDLATQAGAKLRALAIKATAHGIVSVLPIKNVSLVSATLAR